MVGTLDIAFGEIVKKFNELSTEMENTRKAIEELKNVIVKLDKQNYRLQIVGVAITSVLGTIGAIDIILRLLKP